MEGQSTTPDGHSHPPRPYDPNVASTSNPGPQQSTPDPDHSMDWQDVSFMSNEADEVIPEDEDEAAYKRRKARERQRRKRERDRANGIGRNGQPATPRRYPGADVGQFEGSNPFADPPPDPAALAAMSPEEARKEKMRRAARERQRKHRAVVRARRAEDETEVEATQAVASTSGGIPANTSNIQEGTLPVNPPDPVAEGHIEPEVNSSESHSVPYEQQPPPFAYYPPPPMWHGNPFGPGQFFHPHHPHHPGAFVANGQMMPAPHMVPMLPHQQQPPPQTVNPMQMQVSPSPPSPRPAESPAPAPTPSPVPAASTSAPAPSSSSSAPATAPAPVPALPPTAAPAPAQAPAPTPTSALATSTPTPVPASAPPASIPLASLVSVAAAPAPPPPPSHTPGQTFATIITLALNSVHSQMLRAHIMQQLRVSATELTELEGVIARAFDAWDRERGEDSSNQLQQTQVPLSLPPTFHHPPPPQITQPPQTPQTPQHQASHPPRHEPAAQPSHAPPEQSPQPRHPAPPTPQSQPRPARTSASANRRGLGLGQPQPHTLQPHPPQGGTLNVPRPIAGRSTSVGNVGLVPPAVPESQRSVSHPQAGPARSVSVAGQKRPAPGAQPQSRHPMHSHSVPVSSRHPSQSQPRPQSRPGSQPQTPVMGKANGNTVLGHGSTLA